MPAPRLSYLIAIAITVFAGLASRVYAGPAAGFLHAYVGDVLYATMFYWGFRFLSPRRPERWAFTAAIIACWLIEAGQLYQAPWIENLRATRLGGLVLGYGFLWSDLLCYVSGAGLGWALDKLMNRK